MAILFKSMVAYILYLIIQTQIMVSGRISLITTPLSYIMTYVCLQIYRSIYEYFAGIPWDVVTTGFYFIYIYM